MLCSSTPLQALSEIGSQYAQQPIVQRHKTYAMYHPFIDALASMVADYPYKLVTVSIFDIVVYFMAQLKQEAVAFLIFWLTTYLATLAMSGFLSHSRGSNDKAGNSNRTCRGVRSGVLPSTLDT